MADTVTKIEVLLSVFFQVIFFVLFIQTKWYKKELGPYIFRKELGFLVILAFALMANFLPWYQQYRDILRPVIWGLIPLIFGEQLLRFIRDKMKSDKK